MIRLAILAYAATGLFFFGFSMYRVMVLDRRERWMRGADLVLLGGVAVLGSAGWIALLPVYAAGWVRSADAHRQWDRLRGALPPARKRAESVTVGC